MEQLAPGLWQVTGDLPRMPLPRNMVAYRLPDGGLWLHSVIALDEAGMAALDALGPVRFVVVPSGLHRLDAPVYRQRYPEARVVCPAAARAKVEQVVPVDATCEEALPELGIRCHVPAGLKPGELVYELPLTEGVALVFCDALFHVPHLPGLGGWMLRVLGSTGFFGTTRIGWFSLGSDRQAWRAWLLELAERPDLRAISVAHGTAITERCAEHLREAAARL